MAVEVPEKESPDHVDMIQEAVESDHPEVEETPFNSMQFVGTIIAAGFGMIGGSGAFALPASVLAQINADIGPDPNYFWIGLVNTLMLSVGFTLVGRITDIFGRRYFIIGGTVLCMVGTIIASRAKSINMLIGANVLVGLGACAPSSVAYVLGELVPMKHRYLLLGLMFLWMLPSVALGPAVAWAFVLHTKVGWRWCYYLMTITNGISALGYSIFYHPPTFKMKNTKTRLELLKSFDWIGLILFMGGLVVFLIGLSWGGSVHPWKSAEVIAFIVVGGCTIIVFVIYECVAPLKEPLVPMHLFKNTGWVMSVSVMSVAASCYYGFSIIFPQMVFGLYTTDLQYGSYLVCAGPASFILGMILSGLGRYLGRQKWQIVAMSIIAVPLLGGIASATADNKSTVVGLLIVGATAIGYIEGLGLASTGIAIDNQEEVGTAVGVASTLRSGWSTVVVTIYLVVLQNTLATGINQKVVPVLTEAGLSESSVLSFVAAIATGSFASVVGVTPTIIAAGLAAYQDAQVDAFRAVFYTALAFLILNAIMSFWFPNLDDKMTDEVAARLHTTGYLKDKSDKVHVERVEEA